MYPDTARSTPAVRRKSPGPVCARFPFPGPCGAPPDQFCGCKGYSGPADGRNCENENVDRKPTLHPLDPVGMGRTRSPRIDVECVDKRGTEYKPIHSTKAPPQSSGLPAVAQRACRSTRKPGAK